jgi:hypothetical protein
VPWEDSEMTVKNHELSLRVRQNVAKTVSTIPDKKANAPAPVWGASAFTL